MGSNISDKITVQKVVETGFLVFTWFGLVGIVVQYKQLPIWYIVKM